MENANNIPIDELLEISITNIRISPNILNAMKRVGINTLENFISMDLASLMGKPSIGPAKIEKWAKIQEHIRNNWEEISRSYAEKSSIHIVPDCVDYELGLVQVLKEAINSLISIVKSRPKIENDKYFRLLEPYFIHDTDKTTIAQKIGKDYETVRKPLADFTTDFCNGKIVFNNIQLNNRVVEWISSLKNNRYKFHTIDEFISIAGPNNDVMLEILEYDIVEVQGARFLVPENTVRTYRKVASALDKVLQKNFVHLSKDEVIQKTEDIIAENNTGMEYEDEFIEAILTNTDLIDFDDKGLRIKPEFIKCIEDRCARIIYDAGKAITGQDVVRIYEDIYKESIRFQYGQSLTQKGFTANGGHWTYGDNGMALLAFVKEYVEKHTIFYYSDIYKEISDNYSTPNSTIRTYITNLCYVDNDDRTHFCVKEKCEKYPQYKWSSGGRDGLGNWILNRSKEIVEESGPLHLNDLCTKIELRSRDTEYHSRIKERTKAIIGNYTGNELPFIVIDDKITINKAVYNEIDWDIIGRKGGRYPFFSQIRDIAANTIKHRENGRMALMDFVDFIQASIGEGQENFPKERNRLRKLIVDAIDNKKLPSIPIELKNIEGSVHLVATDILVEPEPLYQVQTVNNEDTATTIVEVENTYRENITYRTKYNWEELIEQFMTEFSFCNRWLEEKGLQLESSVQLFRTFMEKATNTNLREMLPQNLYEYFYANTAMYDRKTYVRNLALSYEGLLKEIYIRNSNDVDFKTKGLGDWFARFPELSTAMSIPHRETTKFHRILHDLYFKRNKFAHGEDLAMSSRDIACAITEYTVLYIYTVARFYKANC